MNMKTHTISLTPSRSALYFLRNVAGELLSRALAADAKERTRPISWIISRTGGPNLGYLFQTCVDSSLLNILGAAGRLCFLRHSTGDSDMVFWRKSIQLDRLRQEKSQIHC